MRVLFTFVTLVALMYPAHGQYDRGQFQDDNWYSYLDEGEVALPQKTIQSRISNPYVPPGFARYTVANGDTWKSLTALIPEAMQIAMKVNRMNVNPKLGSKILVPITKQALSYIPVPKKVKGAGKNKYIAFIKEQYFGFYDETGVLVRWGPISSGRPGKVTDLGNFKAGWKDKYHRSTLYDDARMWFAVHFTGDLFIHESEMLPGYPASAGCIRMFWDDAEWVFERIKWGDPIVVVAGADYLF